MTSTTAPLVGAAAAAAAHGRCRWTRPGRRLAGTASIGDLRSMARRRAPRAVFDYTDGGAGDELSLRRSRAAFASVEFRPRVLQDVSTIDTGDGDPRPAGRAAAGVRAHRLHPDDAHRGRAGRRAGGCARRDPLRAVDDGHHLDRAARRRGARRAPVVPALPVAGPGGEPRLRRAGPGGRVRGARPHRRHAGGRSAPPRRAQRPDHSAVAVAAHLRRGGAAPGAGGSTC